VLKATPFKTGYIKNNSTSDIPYTADLCRNNIHHQSHHSRKHPSKHHRSNSPPHHPHPPHHPPHHLPNIPIPETMYFDELFPIQPVYVDYGPEKDCPCCDINLFNSAP